MSTTQTTPAGLSPWQRWVNFWFAPADPTPLGFIRIITGLLVIYTHLAYSFDLQAFFGKNAWYSLESINRERNEFPWMLGDLNDYDDSAIYRHASVPEFPHRRMAVMEFIRGLPADRYQRAELLRYLSDLQAMGNNTQVRDGLNFLNHVGLAGEHRNARLDALVNEALRTPQDPVPDFLANLPQTGRPSREETSKDIERLLDALPRDVHQREYVLNHLTEMDIGARQLFLDFMLNLPDDPTERAKTIDFLEVWNNEAKRAYRLGHPLFSIWFHVTDPTSMAIAHSVIIVIMVLFTIGMYTRVTSVLTWLAAISYIHRSQQVLFGMDTMMNILLIYMMIGPSGAALSVDRLLQRYRAARSGLRRHGKLDVATQAYLEKPPATMAAGLAIRLIQVHFCIIYMASGLSKLKGMSWWSTTAFWDTMINPEFTLVQYHWYEWIVHQVVAYRPLFALIAAGGVIYTLALEISLPFLVWTRLRPYVVIGGFILHFGIAAMMGLIMFGLFMMTLLLGYLPAVVFREMIFGSKPSTKATVTYRFSNRDPAQQRAAAWVKALDFDGRVELVETNAKEGDVVVAVGNQQQTGSEALKSLRSVLAFPRLLGIAASLPVLGGMVRNCLVPGVATPGNPTKPSSSNGSAVTAS